MRLIPDPYLTLTGQKRYIFFHNKRHPAEMGEAEIRSFVSDLASNKSVAASTQTVALSALLFLYRDVLKQDLPYIEGIEGAKRPERLPVVFTHAEVREVLARLDGVKLLDCDPALWRRIIAACPSRPKE